MGHSVLVDSYLRSLQESFAWQPNTIFIHELVQSNQIVDERLDLLYEKGILRSRDKAYVVSFMHPDMEYACSFVIDRLPKGATEKKAWFAFADPQKLMINKRMSLSGFSFEALSKPVMESSAFLSSGRTCKFKKLHEIPCTTISTTVPVPLPFAVWLWENFRSRLESNKLNLRTMQFRRGKLWTLPQIVSKSNYFFVFRMRTQ